MLNRAGCLLLALVAQDALLARIVHVVLGRRCDLTLRVVAHHAILPTLQLVRDLGRKVDQEGGRLGRAGWRVAVDRQLVHLGLNGPYV